MSRTSKRRIKNDFFRAGRDKRFAWFLAGLVAIAAGCGPSGPERVKVSGTVTFQGSPLKNGTIVFVPAEGTKAPPSGANIENGRYMADRQGRSAGRNPPCEDSGDACSSQVTPTC